MLAAMLIHEKNISHFVVVCETYHPKYIHFGTKIRSLTQRRKHYNTLKLEVLPRLQKRKLCFTLPVIFCDTYTAYLAADACPLNTFILSPGARALIIP